MLNLLPTRLRLLRQEKHLTQNEMAREILVPRVTYTHYELGKRTPDLDTIIQLARFHKVSVDFLVGNAVMRPNLEQWLAENSQSDSNDKTRLLYPVEDGSPPALIADQPADEPAAGAK